MEGHELDNFLERLFLGQSFESLIRVPTPEQIFRGIGQDMLTAFSTRIHLGWNDDEGEVKLAHEERQANMHIMGLPGEGKSMLMQLLMREDIDRLIAVQKESERTGKVVKAPGLCLIDGSDGGDTAVKMLQYCAIRGYHKVAVLDPSDMFEYKLVPCLNPFQHLSTYHAVNLIMDTVQSSWGSQWKSNPNIRRFTTALSYCLAETRYTLADSKWFMSDDKDFEPIRKMILNRTMKVERDGKEVDVPILRRNDIQRKDIERSFADRFRFEAFQSTVNRLKYFTLDKLELITGSPTGWKVQDLISEGYVIIAALDSSSWGREAQTLLGTLLINELIYHKELLKKHGHTVPYHLYIDEVHQFASPKLSQVIDEKRKLNLWVCAAHQRLNQIKDEDLRDALASVPIVAVFNTNSHEDRMKFAQRMYGGEIKDRDASFAMKDTAKRTAYVKIHKRKPMKVEIREFDDIGMTPDQLKQFKQSVVYNLTINPHYRPLADVRGEINNRFASAQNAKFTKGDNLVAAKKSATGLAGGGKGNDSKPSSPTRPAGRQGATSPQADNQGEDGQVREASGVQVRGDVRPDFTDVQTVRKRRGSPPQQGDQPPGGQGQS